MKVVKKIAVVMMITSLIFSMAVPWNTSETFATTKKKNTASVENETINAKVEAIKKGYVKISWDSIAKAESYEIYRANGLDASFRKVKTVNSGNEYTYKRSGAARYCYKVVGIKTVNGKKKEVKASDIVYCKSIPEKITSKSYYENIELSWKRIDDAKKYTVRYYESAEDNKANESYELANPNYKTITFDFTDKNAPDGLTEGKTYYFTVSADGGPESIKIAITKTSTELRPDFVAGVDFGNDAISNAFILDKNPEPVNDTDYLRVQVGNKLGGKRSHKITIDRHLFDTDAVGIASSLLGYRIPRSNIDASHVGWYAKFDTACKILETGAEIFKVGTNLKRLEEVDSGTNYVYIPKALFNENAYQENISTAEQIYSQYSKSFTDKDVGDAYFNFSDSLLGKAKQSVPMAWSYIDDGKTYVVLLCPETNNKPLKVTRNKRICTYDGYMQTFIIGEESVDIIMQTVSMKVNLKDLE